MFTYDNKTYKSQSAMKSAKTRDTKKKLLAELFKRDSDINEINRLQNILNSNEKEQKQTNIDKQKVRREYKKTAVGVDIDVVAPTKKNSEVRKFNRVIKQINSKKSEKNEITPDEKWKNNKNALNGRITELTYDLKGLNKE